LQEFVESFYKQPLLDQNALSGEYSHVMVPCCHTRNVLVHTKNHPILPRYAHQHITHVNTYFPPLHFIR